MEPARDKSPHRILRRPVGQHDRACRSRARSKLTMTDVTAGNRNEKVRFATGTSGMTVQDPEANPFLAPPQSAIAESRHSPAVHLPLLHFDQRAAYAAGTR